MYIFPIDSIEENERVILYGAGSVGRDFYQQIVYSDYCNLVKWIDIKGENVDVFEPDCLRELLGHFDRVVIAIKDETMAKSVIDYLHNKYGIENDSMLWVDYAEDTSVPINIQELVVENYYKDHKKPLEIIRVRFEGMFVSQMIDFLRVFGEYRIKIDADARMIVYGTPSYFYRLEPVRGRNKINIAYWPEECHAPRAEFDYQFTSQDFNTSTNCFMTGARDEFRILENLSIPIDHKLFERRFCNFVYFNSTWGEGSQYRKDFCEKLMRYKRVDCPGNVLNNMSNDEVGNRFGNWYENKLQFIRKYKFTIAFENERKKGYIDEKLIQPLAVGSIPIYYGAEDVGDYINKECFIDTRDYDDDWDAVVEKVKEIDNDEEKYLHMLSKAPLVIENFSKKRRTAANAFISSMLEAENLIERV